MKRHHKFGIGTLLLPPLLIFLIHVFFNNPLIQKISFNTIDRYLGIKIQADLFHFNVLTGHFSGKSITVNVRKTDVTVHLDDFSLAVEPLHLILKKINLLHLKANNLVITVREFSEKVATAQKPAIERLEAAIQIFQVDFAEIKTIEVNLPNDHQLRADRLLIKESIPLLFYKNSLTADVETVSLTSPKFDAFIDKISANGSFDIREDRHTHELEPSFDGGLDIHHVLLGLNKKANPGNTSPGWDPSLTPIIEARYVDFIPANRTFAYISDLNTAFTFTENHLAFHTKQFNAFDGELLLKGIWNRKTGLGEADLSTLKPFKMALLPLGKAKFRTSFERAAINVQQKGTFKDLSSAEAHGTMEVSLINNVAVPESKLLKLTANTRMQNSYLSLENVRGELNDGLLTGRGGIDFANKRITHGDLTGKNFDAQTVIRFFSSIDVPAKADFTTQMAGWIDDPDFKISLSSPDVSYESLHFGPFTGDLNIRNKNLQLNGTAVLDQAGHSGIDLKVSSIFSEADRSTTLKTTFQNLPAGGVFNKREVLSGEMEGNFDLEKNNSGLLGKGLIRAKNINWYGVHADEISGTIRLDDKSFALAPLSVVWNADLPPITQKESLVFNILPTGYQFKGTVLPGLSAEGEFKKENPDHLLVKAKATRFPLLFLQSALPLQIDHFILTGDFDADYNFKLPLDSKLTAKISDLDFSGEERNITLKGLSEIDYASQAFTFKNTNWKIGAGDIGLDGTASFKGDSNLKVRGVLDFYQIGGLQSVLAEGGGLARVDVTVGGPITQPVFTGQINFQKAEMLPRKLGRELTNIEGLLKLSPNRYDFQNLALQYDDAPMRLNGWVEMPFGQNIQAADLNIHGSEIPINSEDVWNILVDADVRLAGSGENLLLKGNANIVEGLYYKDYNISQFILRPVGVAESTDFERDSFFKNINVDLNVRSTGEFLVKNNITDLTLSMNFNMRGTFNAPIMSGALNITEGQIHTFGIDFSDATGFATFVPLPGAAPILDIIASHTIQEYEVHAHLKGYTDNLSLTLESTPALSHNELISLVAYGRTPDQLVGSNQNLFSTAAIASQIVGMLQRPISNATKLDVVRLESVYDPNADAVSRFSIGKQLSDRVTVAFTTDISLDEAFKGAVFEYRLFDNLLLKGTKDTGSRYRFELAWRLQAY